MTVKIGQVKSPVSVCFRDYEQSEVEILEGEVDKLARRAMAYLEDAEGFINSLSQQLKDKILAVLEFLEDYRVEAQGIIDSMSNAENDTLSSQRKEHHRLFSRLQEYEIAFLTPERANEMSINSAMIATNMPKFLSVANQIVENDTGLKLTRMFMQVNAREAKYPKMIDIWDTGENFQKTNPHHKIQFRVELIDERPNKSTSKSNES